MAFRSLFKAPTKSILGSCKDDIGEDLQEYDLKRTSLDEALTASAYLRCHSKAKNTDQDSR